MGAHVRSLLTGRQPLGGAAAFSAAVEAWRAVSATGVSEGVLPFTACDRSNSLSAPARLCEIIYA